MRRVTDGELRPAKPGEVFAGETAEEGDYVGRSPVNHDDQWIVRADKFAEIFLPDPLDY